MTRVDVSHELTEFIKWTFAIKALHRQTTDSFELKASAVWPVELTSTLLSHEQIDEHVIVRQSMFGQNVMTKLIGKSVPII